MEDDEQEQPGEPEGPPQEITGHGGLTLPARGAGNGQ